MARNIMHEGSESDVMPFTNTTGADIAAGAVVKLKHAIGIALTDIAQNATGSVAVEGVILNVPKVTGTAWAQGEKLLWDASASKFDGSGATPATGDLMGGVIAWLAAASADAVGVVKLTPGNATLT